MDTQDSVGYIDPYSPKALFQDLYNSTSEEIPYSDDWANGTGYLDYAFDCVNLAPGQTAKSVCPNGRKILFLGTRLKPCVVFQRYSNSEETYVAHVDPGIQDVMCFSTPLTASDVYVLLGRASRASYSESAKGAYGHVGQRMEAYTTSIERRETL